MRKTIATFVLIASLFVAQAQEIGGGGTVTTSTQRVKGQKGQTFTPKNGFVSYLNLGGGTFFQGGFDFGYRRDKSEIGLGIALHHDWRRYRSHDNNNSGMPIYAYYKRNFGNWNWRPLIELDLGWCLPIFEWPVGTNGFYTKLQAGVSYKNILELKVSGSFNYYYAYNGNHIGYRDYIVGTALIVSINLETVGRGIGKFFFPNKVK